MQPHIPVDMIKAYRAHPKFGQVLQTTAAAFHEEFGFSGPYCSVLHDNNTQMKKRHTEEPMRTHRKPKVDPVSIVESSTLTDELKCECAVANFKGGAVKLQIWSTLN